MTKETIETALCECIEEIQEMSGEEAAEVSPETCPIVELEGFDSLRGVEATVLLELKLDLAIDASKGNVNLFVSPDGQSAMTIGEIVQRIIKQIGGANE